MNSENLIAELVNITKENLNTVRQLRELNFDTLNYKKSSKKWSALECIEHLNRYGDFYIPEIAKSIRNNSNQNTGNFKSGLLGNYFAKSMKAGDKTKKMNSPKDMNPTGSSLSKDILDTFEKQNLQLIKLLEKAKSVCLTRCKTPITLTSWIQLRLGDTLRVVIYHNERHIIQAKKAIEGFSVENRSKSVA